MGLFDVSVSCKRLRDGLIDGLNAAGKRKRPVSVKSRKHNCYNGPLVGTARKRMVVELWVLGAGEVHPAAETQQLHEDNRTVDLEAFLNEILCA
jgi:hypothetical protein